MGSFRLFGLLTALIIAGLYGVNFAIERKVSAYSDPLGELLDPGADSGYVTWHGRVLRLHRIVFLLHDAEDDAVDVEQALDDALAPFGYSPGFAPVLKRGLIENVRIGQRHGLFTDGNRQRLATGKLPHITMGAFTGEAMGARAVIPGYLAPEIAMHLANLKFTPQNSVPVDRAPDRIKRAEAFHAAAMIGDDRLRAIRRALGARHALR